MSHIGVFGDKKTSIRKVVTHMHPVLPVGGGQLKHFDWIWLYVYIEVTEVHEGMDPGLNKYDSSNKFMKVNGVI